MVVGCHSHCHRGSLGREWAATLSEGEPEHTRCTGVEQPAVGWDVTWDVTFCSQVFISHVFPTSPRRPGGLPSQP